MNKIRLGALLGAITLAFGLSGCVADGTYYGGGPAYYGGGYGPGYYGAPGPVVVEGGPVYRETVVVENARYRRWDGYYGGDRRPDSRYAASRRGGGGYYAPRRGPARVEARRGAGRRTPDPVYHRAGNKKRQDFR